jgi:hypothetical protein
MTARQVYAALLRLYPREYRDAFAEEMSSAFETAAEERRAHGRLPFAWFLLAEWGGLLAGAAADRLAKLTTRRSVRGRVLPDLRLMRPPEIPPEVWFAGLRRRPARDEAHGRVDLLVDRMMFAIAARDFKAARDISYQERGERDQLRRLRADPFDE